MVLQPLIETKIEVLVYRIKRIMLITLKKLLKIKLERVSETLIDKILGNVRKSQSFLCRNSNEFGKYLENENRN